MSTLRLSLAIAAVMACLAPISALHAQIVSGLDSGRHSGPFIEPDAFQPDFQFFAPSDVSDYNERVRPNTGFFFQYDRVYINVSRPRDGSAVPPNFNLYSNQFDGDWTWGNRLEGGFREEDGKGWAIVGWHIDGPNASFNYNSANAPEPFLRQDGITPLEIINSQNTAKYSALEINRVFESLEFHRGGYLEPFVGLKFAQFKDLFRRTYPAAGSPGSPPDGYFASPVADYLTSTTGGNENNMLGAQIGCRIFKEVGHWKFNTELRAFLMENAQLYSEVNEWSATGFVLIRSPSTFTGHATSEVWGGELRSEVAYKVTRDISIIVGIAFIDFANGVGRMSQGAVPSSLVPGGLVTPASYRESNNFEHIVAKDVFMGGITFGFEINR